MASYLVVVAFFLAALTAIARSQFNVNSALGFLQKNPQAFNLLSQALGGSQNAQAAANGQCVNSENMLANTMLCAIAGKQCGVNMGSNPVTSIASALAGTFTSQLSQISGLVSSNPVICIIVKQACCLSASANGAQLASSLAGVLLGSNSNMNIGGFNLGSILGGLGGGNTNNYNTNNNGLPANIASMLPSFLQGRG